MSNWSWREERKRSRDDYEIRDGPPRIKRGRWSDPGRRGSGGRGNVEISTEDKLESLVVRLGEKTQSSLESNLENLSEIICNELTEYKDHIIKIITRCAGDLAEKTTVYSALVGILNARKFDVGEEVVDLLLEDLKLALSVNNFQKIKTLVRFIADLVNSRVIPSSSIISLFDTFMTVTYEPGISQLRSDWYTYIVLSALPWVAGELLSKRQTELDRILTTIDTYMSKRHTTYLPALQVWTTDRPHPQRDYLELLWIQILKMKDEGWKENVVLRPYVAFDSEISSAYSHPLHNIVVPGHTSDSTYPLPSAVFQCFGENDLPAHSNLTLPAIDSSARYLATELIYSTILSHSANRKHCALQLNILVERLHHIPMEYILVEVLFGLIFQLPAPPHSLVYYGSLIIELCKIRAATFPTILTQLTNLLFSHLDHMNYVVAHRFAWWFSYHLSNYQYIWDWNGWFWCMQCTPDHPSRWFIHEVFGRCVRLASYEVFVELVPEPLVPLLPSIPQPMFLYNEQSTEEIPGIDVARKLLQAIRAKEPIEELLSLINSASSFLPDHIVSDESKTLQIKILILTHCVLHVGEKTISHCFTALHKFRSLFLDLLDGDETKIICLNAVAQFYISNPLVHCLVIDRLVRQQIIDNLVVIKWLLTSEMVLFTSRFSWDVVKGVLFRISSSLKQASKQLEEVKYELKQKSGLDEVTGGLEERQEVEWRVMELEEKVDERNKEQREVSLAICEGLVSLLVDHLTRCDQEAIDYETTWFSCVLDHLRQLLVENLPILKQYSHLLESSVFSSETDPRILEIYKEFKTLL